MVLNAFGSFNAGPKLSTSISKNLRLQKGWGLGMRGFSYQVIYVGSNNTGGIARGLDMWDRGERCKVKHH